MEQYAHLLIAADPDYVAKPAQIIGFLELVKDAFRFRFVKSKEEWLPGLRATTSAEDLRTMKNPYTGEKQTYKVPKWFELEHTNELPALVGSEPKYGITMSGKWAPSDVPIQMLVGDGSTIDVDLICFVGCSQRARPVCTGDWWVRRIAGIANSVLTTRTALFKPSGFLPTRGLGSGWKCRVLETLDSGSSSNLGNSSSRRWKTALICFGLRLLRLPRVALALALSRLGVAPANSGPELR